MLKPDYRKFKTPFVEIWVADSKGNNKTKLPEQLARLVEKVEITEVYDSEYGHINVTFSEGSREPYKISPGSGANPDIYPLEGGDTSLFSNQTGTLLDLRFSSGGLTSLVPGLGTLIGGLGEAAAAATEAVEGVQGAVGAIASLAGKDNTPEIPLLIEESIAAPLENINYFFRARNIITVRWGYKEDADTWRIKSSYIQMVRADFPETGTPRVEVIAISTEAFLDQLTVKKTKPFRKKVAAGTSESGKPIYDFQDLSVFDVVSQICEDHQIECKISATFNSIKLESGAFESLPSSISVSGFLNTLAKKYDAFFKAELEKNNRPIIFFIDRDDWETSPLLSSSYLLTYRGANSILKSVKLTADYGNTPGVSFKGITNRGSVINVTNQKLGRPLFNGQKPAPTDPRGDNPLPHSENLNSSASGSVGRSFVHPDPSDVNNQKRLASSANNYFNEHTVSLDFATIGYPGITLGKVQFKGLGERYSGFYYIKKVQHVIDSNGYNCSGLALSSAVAKGGVNPAPVAKETQTEPKEELNLFLGAENHAGAITKDYIKTLRGDGFIEFTV